MKVNINTANMELTEALEEYVYKKLSKVESHIPTGVESIGYNVVIGKTTNHHLKGDVFESKIDLNLTKGDYVVSKTEDDLYKAIDSSVGELERSVVTDAKKKRSLLRRGALRVKRIIKGVVSPYK
jgi:ribosomal subunit interface protein